MHQAVLLEETIDHLMINDKGRYVDCTVGGGGHLRHLMSRLKAGALVIGLDKDSEVLERTGKTLPNDQLLLVQSDFRNLQSVLQEHGIDAVDGIMMDLGVSSFQLDEAERGFSFHEDAALDMRMNREQAFSAMDLVNTWEEESIAGILYRYGEERYSRRIARAIVEARKQRTIETTLQLVEIIRGSVPARYSRETHPARRSFQAIRIAVNGELDALMETLPQAVDVLKPGGRLCIITFHSLEDRIVKQFFQEQARECICPPGMPVCTCNHQARLKLITRKPIVSGTAELENNPRARSAKLRVAERI